MSKTEIYEMIKKDIQEEDTAYYKDNYNSWHHFLSDYYFYEDNIDEIDEVLIEKGNEHWEMLWKETHKEII